MKVFVSSVIGGLEEFRTAANSGITTLGHQALRAEDFPASSQTAQQACLGAVRASDVVVLLLGESYGAVQASGLSATHEEYREARGTKPVTVFIQRGIEPDELQRAFIEEVQEWTSGHTTKLFDASDRLTEAVIKALHEHELATAAGEADTNEMLERARDILSFDHQPHGGLVRTTTPSIELAVVGGPLQQILRPAELESAELANDLQQTGMFGGSHVLNKSLGTTVEIQGDTLILLQDQPRVSVSQSGSVVVRLPIASTTGGPGYGLPAIIEEDVAERIASAIGFSVEILDRIDPTHRLTRFVLLCRLANSAYATWRTRAEHQANPQSAAMSRGSLDNVVGLSPPSVGRQALLHDAAALTEDLVTLLKRER